MGGYADWGVWLETMRFLFTVYKFFCGENKHIMYSLFPVSVRTNKCIYFITKSFYVHSLTFI